MTVGELVMKGLGVEFKSRRYVGVMALLFCM